MTAQKSRFDVLGQLGALRRYALSLTRGDADAEDLVQDALLRAYEKRGSFDKRRDLRPWLLSILHNVFVDRRRAQRAEVERIEHAGALAEPHLAAVQDHHVRLNQVRRAFIELPEAQRAALHLVAIEGLTFAEAASALGIPVGTLMSRLARARAALRALDDEGVNEEGEGPAPDPGRRLRIVGGSDGPSG